MIHEVVKILRQSGCDRLRFEINPVRNLLFIELLNDQDLTSTFHVDLQKRFIDLPTYEEEVFEIMINKFHNSDEHVENDVREI